VLLDTFSTRRTLIYRRLSIGVAATVLICAAALVLLKWPRPIDPIEPPQRSSFSKDAILRGAQLAALADCAGCHTATHGAPFAGGTRIDTPFGSFYGSNLTPDPRTGIGRWSLAAFMRAMRDGVARDGRHLYPAFPYDHFSSVTDADLAALYAFLMTGTPVVAEPPPARLRFPFGFRPLLAFWNLLFLPSGSYIADPKQSAEWNRGAYLVQSLGHCGACHTPRNVLGAEDRARALQGGEAEGWYAPPINAESPSPLPWTADELHEYLRTGLTRSHAIAGGPMAQVVSGMNAALDADVRAIAVYIAAQMGDPRTPERTARGAASATRAAQPLTATPTVDGGDEIVLGASIYASACASCHDRGRSVSSNGALQLPVAVAVYDSDPRSLLRIVRDGIAPGAGTSGRWMPAFGSSLTDDQLTALAAYLRRHAANAAPWPDLSKAVVETRR
jgi:mono/diheme cytochrome c family protein